MGHKEEFIETLKSLGIDDVSMDGFTSEQIYYQIADKMESRLNFIELEVNNEYERYSKMKENGEKIITESRAANITPVSAGDESDSNRVLDSDVSSGHGENSSENCTSDGSECDNDYTDDRSEDGSDGSSESDVSFGEGDWEGPELSDEEIILEPADKVVKMLGKRFK